ncbi:MAG TPA: AMP-binding protein [Woeseiaceae bacterium]|nr:AMP-binding protein [Woeseiaceae bacterium]
MFDRIPDITAQRAMLKPDAVAFRDLARGTTLTYLELEKNVQSLAGFLHAGGVGEGDRIAVLCRNRVEFFELLFAAGKLGAVLVPLNWRMPAGELAPLVDDAAPKFLFFGEEDAAVAQALGNDGTERVGLDDDSGAGYAARRAAAEPFAGRAFWGGNDTWYLIYTSGTTGKPKAVVQTPAMALANYVNIRQAMAISGEDTCLNYLPLFHTAGINLVTLPTLIEGGEILVIPGFDVDRVVRLLADGVLDTFFAVPAVYQQISLHPAFRTLDLGRVRNWGCGGAPMPDYLIQSYLERGARVCNGMGMTETGPTVFIMDTAMVDKKIGSVGKPQVLARVRLVGPDGDDVEQGEEGELWFAGPGITPGYWGNPEATRDAFADGGWLKSGDIGRQDADGYYYIAGRIKEMFISGGENVYPAEVENVLAAHPDILEAAVVAVPDEKWGEVGRAYLLPQPGHEIPPASDITVYCRERLAAYKVPKEYVSVQEFPRTAAGKVQKHLLAAGDAS